jgi:hypothetical protein
MTRVYVYRTGELSADAGTLSAAEQAELAVHAFGPRRRVEWIRGRAAAHKALDDFAGDGASAASILVHPDGAPRVTGCPGVAMSLSHDGDYVAVALCRGTSATVGVDLCLHSHRERARGILHRLAVTAGALDPVVQWAAIETALKLRRMAVTELLDARVSLGVRDSSHFDAMPDVSETSGVRISGLGRDVDVVVRVDDEYAMAWGAER